MLRTQKSNMQSNHETKPSPALYRSVDAVNVPIKNAPPIIITAMTA